MVSRPWRNTSPAWKCASTTERHPHAADRLLPARFRVPRVEVQGPDGPERMVRRCTGDLLSIPTTGVPRAHTGTEQRARPV